MSPMTVDEISLTEPACRNIQAARKFYESDASFALQHKSLGALKTVSGIRNPEDRSHPDKWIFNRDKLGLVGLSIRCSVGMCEIRMAAPQNGRSITPQARTDARVPWESRPTWAPADRLIRSPNCFCEMPRGSARVRRFCTRISASGRHGLGPKSPRSYVLTPRACIDLDCSQETRSPS